MLDQTAIRKEQQCGQNQGPTTVYPTQASKSRNEHSVGKSRLSSQYGVERMELENLMAKQQAEQQLKDRQIQLES